MLILETNRALMQKRLSCHDVVKEGLGSGVEEEKI
jgi:hypothetical protein